MKKLVSPLPWVGSKRQPRNSIIARIPNHTCYAEPFAGGAWVYFGKEPSPVEVINDVNGDLIAMYRAIKSKPEEFYEALWYMFPSRQLQAESRTILDADRESQCLTEVERAVLFYYHIKNCFGGKFGGGFAFSKVRPPRHMIAHDLLVALRDRLQNTYIENLSFERLIKNYDGPETFFYLDPPYLMDKKDKCYQFEFTMADHERLREVLGNIQAKWLLSYGDKKEIREFYRGFKIEKTEPVTYTLSGKAVQKTELLISNY